MGVPISRHGANTFAGAMPSSEQPWHVNRGRFTHSGAMFHGVHSVCKGNPPGWGSALGADVFLPYCQLSVLEVISVDLPPQVSISVFEGFVSNVDI